MDTPRATPQARRLPDVGVTAQEGLQCGCAPQNGRICSSTGQVPMVNSNPPLRGNFFCSDNKGSNVSRQLLEIIFLVSLYKKIVKMEIIC